VPNPNVLVGLDTSDDAGVYRLTDELALVQTVDFFTPIVDDPYMFGQIAAANALSDVYAMGGTPLTVLNIVGFPVKKLDMSILAEILRGAADKVAEAGATIIGGHSIDDVEPKFGLSVTGLVHPERVRANCGACANDRLILTKPIGVGIQTTAIKRDLLTDDQIARVSKVMAQLNKRAAEIMNKYTVHAVTDITGFGLLGHAYEMALGSGVGMVIDSQKVPVLEGTYELAEKGIVPGGTRANAQWLKDVVTYADHVDEIMRTILCDAVTSGGLLISVKGEEAQTLLDELIGDGIEAAIVGEITDQHPGKIVVV